MTRTDYILIFTSIGGVGAFIAAVVLLSLRIKNHFDTQFSEHRKFMYAQGEKRDRAILRLEYWAILVGNKMNVPYQPAIDPPHLMAGTDGRNAVDGRS